MSNSMAFLGRLLSLKLGHVGLTRSPLQIPISAPDLTWVAQEEFSAAEFLSSFKTGIYGFARAEKNAASSPSMPQRKGYFL